MLWGFDVTHLSAHLGAFCSRPEFFDIYLDLAIEFDLPISLPDPSIDLGFEARALATAEGVLVPDREVSAALSRAARNDIDAITPHRAARVSDAHLVTQDWAFRAALDRSGAELISFRELRSAQRRSR